MRKKTPFSNNSDIATSENNNLKRKKSFKTFIILIITICALLPVIIFTGVNYALSLNSSKEQYDNRITSEILKIDELVSTYFGTIMNAVNSYTKNELLTEADDRITSYIDKEANTDEGKVKMDVSKFSDYEKQVYDYFGKIVDNNPDIATLTVGIESNGGILIYPTSDRTPGYDARTRGWYKTGKESSKDTSMTDVYISSNGKRSVEIVSKIFGKTGDFRGIITGSVLLNDITSKLEEENVGKDGKIIIVDRNGIIVSNPFDRSTESSTIDTLGIENLSDINNINYNKYVAYEGKMYLPVKSSFDALGFTYIGVIDAGTLK